MGRHTKLAAVIVGFILIVTVVVGIGVILSSGYLRRASVRADAVCLDAQPVHHEVIIRNNVPSHVNTTGKLCDTLTITNMDDSERLIAFGPHEDHQPYDGVTEKVLGKGQSLTVTFDQAGSFSFHDHFDDNVRGHFVVSH